MPIYEYECAKCKNSFEMSRPMAARDEAVACPQCGGTQTGRKLSVVSVGADKAGAGAAAGGGHVHTGMCGCGRVPGSCGMGM